MKNEAQQNNQKLQVYIMWTKQFGFFYLDLKFKALSNYDFFCITHQQMIKTKYTKFHINQNEKVGVPTTNTLKT